MVFIRITDIAYETMPCYARPHRAEQTGLVERVGSGTSRLRRTLSSDLPLSSGEEEGCCGRTATTCMLHSVVAPLQEASALVGA